MSRPRVLIVTDQTDYFVGKILGAVVAGGFEPLPIDVLRFGPRPGEALGTVAMHHAVPMPSWPAGVREFALADLTAAVTPGGGGFDAFLGGYAKIAVLSLHPGTADLIHHVLDHHPALPLSVLNTDDDIDRHYLFHRERAADPAREAELREILLYPPSVERAFQRVARFFINPQPWLAMLRIGRTDEPSLIPWMTPVINRVPGVEDVKRLNHAYSVVLFVKPSVGLAQFQDVARTIAAGNKGRPVQIVTFRNDMPTQSEIDGVPVRCYPYPLDEVAYHRILAAAHGVVIVPRGGLSAIRDAVRYGLDVITPVENLINHIVLTADVGLEMTGIDDLRLDDPDGKIAQRRENNRAALARYEFGSIAAFRREYGLE